jgi:hypothetical protein
MQRICLRRHPNSSNPGYDHPWLHCMRRRAWAQGTGRAPQQREKTCLQWGASGREKKRALLFSKRSSRREKTCLQRVADNDTHAGTSAVVRNTCDNHALQELETALGFYTRALEKARGVELRSGSRTSSLRTVCSPAWATHTSTCRKSFVGKGLEASSTLLCACILLHVKSACKKPTDVMSAALLFHRSLTRSALKLWSEAMVDANECLSLRPSW